MKRLMHQARSKFCIMLVKYSVHVGLGFEYFVDMPEFHIVLINHVYIVRST